jgi:DNA-binding Lrp family transcriptional regulator
MLDNLGRQLIDRYQRNMPLSARPYAEMARSLGISEEAVIARLKLLQEAGLISRVGPIFDHGRAGASTLAAMKVPPTQAPLVADIINGCSAVNHNYEREHEFNLWFVLTAPDQATLARTIAGLEAETGYPVLNLPMEKSYHIDLAFPIEWSTPS